MCDLLCVCVCRTFKIRKGDNFSMFHEALAGALVSVTVCVGGGGGVWVWVCNSCNEFHNFQGYTRPRVRVWPFEKRNNGTVRPTFVDQPNDMKKTVRQS